MKQLFSLKNIIISIVTTIIAVAAIVAINIYQTNEYNSVHSAFLNLEVKPAGTVVLLDGEVVNTDTNTIRITPGKHSLAVLHSGFFPDGEEFTIEEGKYHDNTFILMPYTEEAQKIFDAIEDY